MKIQDVKDWWNNHPGWHERIIWTAVGAAATAFILKVL